MTEIVLLARFVVGSGELGRATGLLSEYADVVQSEPGNLEFRPAVSGRIPGELLVLERYVDQAAFEAHLGDARGASFNAELAPLLSEPVHLTFFPALPGRTYGDS
jgi:quinol monooxygenase YgiN